MSASDVVEISLEVCPFLSASAGVPCQTWQLLQLHLPCKWTFGGLLRAAPAQEPCTWFASAVAATGSHCQ